jgi:flavin-dependent dehydrogenase
MDAWMEALERTVPSLARKVRGGTVTARLRGHAGLPNHVRRPAGQGWALVGDAGYHRDPITGHGITDAFRDADLLAEAIDDTLCGRLTEHDAMARYEGRRNAAIEETFVLTRKLGAFPPKAEFLDLQFRLSKALETEARALVERPAPVGGDRRHRVDSVA